ncbi:BC1872 family protein [Brevibacillus thermoruber]|jgi:hypothetical protein|uniref:BC1872 family protein n=1 Tax=Brevibacillus thermoruber TaxID=33942 RepID=UPI00054D1E4F|nr:hypothetical protein [Brevibacillus thermoruber]
MTEQQIIETLATKVMGWKQVNLGLSIIWVDADGRDVSAQVDSWNPLQNIADAWMIVERLNTEFYFEIFRIALSVSESGKEPFVAYFGAECAVAETAPKAISMAAYQLVA